ILVNPTGKPGNFHGVDWCVELYNLFIKFKNGGVGSNKMVERIILEPPLVQVYHNTHLTVEKNLLQSHLTSKHADTDMRKIFAILLKDMEINLAHNIKLGHKTRYVIPNLLDKGIAAYTLYT
ncbi:hypothetical protein SERLADRAFT_350775, partial [Serpula lacrymans var. lacrymans S7.9]